MKFQVKGMILCGGGDIIPVVYRLGKVVPGDSSSAISPMFTNKFWEKWASPAVGPDKAGLIIQIILPKQPDIVRLQQLFGSEQLVRKNSVLRIRINCVCKEHFAKSDLDPGTKNKLAYTHFSN